MLMSSRCLVSSGSTFSEIFCISWLVFASLSALNTYDTFSRSLPLFSRAPMVFLNVGFSGFSAIAATSAFSAFIPSSNAGR
jgi:hypothetical protein